MENNKKYTDNDYKNRLYRLIYGNLSRQMRKAETEDVKERVENWWVRCNKFTKLTPSEWETCFLKEEDRKGSVISASDFCNAIEAYTPPVKASNLKKNSPASKHFAKMILEITNDEILGRPKRNLTTEFIREFKMAKSNMDTPVVEEWIKKYPELA